MLVVSNQQMLDTSSPERSWWDRGHLQHALLDPGPSLHESSQILEGVIALLAPFLHSWTLAVMRDKEVVSFV